MFLRFGVVAAVLDRPGDEFALSIASDECLKNFSFGRFVGKKISDTRLRSPTAHQHLANAVAKNFLRHALGPWVARFLLSELDVGVESRAFCAYPER